MTHPTIFLEISIQVRRALASRPEQDQLEAQIEQLAPHLYSTHYVWMEFQRTVVADYAHVRWLMLNQAGWGDVLTHLLTGQRAFRSRSAVRCTQILGHLYNDSRADWEYALQWMDQAVRRRLRMLFWTHITPLSDPIVCDLVATGIARQSDGSYTVADTCRKETAACHLPEFLAGHRPKLRAIADYLATHPRAIKDQKRVERLLSAVMEEPRAALGQARCWPLGDVIIALQVPAGAAIWTLDTDFEPLAEVLGLSLYTPDATPQ